MIRLLTALLLMATPAVAEDVHEDVARSIRLCLDNVDRPEECIGRYITLCTYAETAFPRSVGMVAGISTVVT
ncbi:MAG: hypothetical protein AAFQ51_19960, partial [Pseudomonadota bacterium]